MWVLGILAALAVVVVAVQGLAGFYVNFLWFSTAHVEVVWRAIVVTKLGLAGAFVLVAFALVWASLWLVDKVAQRTLFMPVESELVRRYHAAVIPHAFVLRTGVSVVAALALGTGAATQWQHWLLFEHAVPFGYSDPQFGRDASFYVFRLPFLSFLVDWLLAALLVTLVISMLAHFLNGTIRVQGPAHVEPRAIAHLSLLLGLMALVRAWGYYYVDRFILMVPRGRSPAAASNATDLSVRLQATTLLAVVALIVFVLLVVNIYQRNLLVPALAVGLWGLVALAVGIIYPAIDGVVTQAPAGGVAATTALRNELVMTERAMAIDHVATETRPANVDLKAADLAHYQQMLSDVTLWDDAEARAAFSQLQQQQPYYAISGLAENRAVIGGRLQPTLLGVRQVSASNLPSQDWQSIHVQYNHGQGAVLAPANAASPAGSPVFEIGGLPSGSSGGAPSLSAAGSRIYFAPGGREYVLVDAGEPSIDYQTPRETVDAPPYRGGVAIDVGGLLHRIAFAVKLRDFNLLVSNRVTPRTRMLFVTGPRQRVEKALPFLKIDSHPYGVIAAGQLYWVYSGYSTTSYFPDAEPALTSALAPGSGLAGSYDYVRNAVVALVNASTGWMGVYATPQGQQDPLLRSYEATYPNLIQSPQRLKAFARGAVWNQLRYPQDLLLLQGAMYGAVHAAPQSNAAVTAGAESWSVASASSAGSLAPGGAPAVPAAVAYQPQYELVQWRPDTSPRFSLVEPLVPYTGNGIASGSSAASQTLSALFVADSSPAAFGQLTVYEVKPDVPAPAAAYVMQSTAEQAAIERLAATAGGPAVPGTVEVLPVADGLVYVTPLYTEPSSSPYPHYAGMLVLYGKSVVLAPNLDKAMAELLHGTVNGVAPGPSPATGSSQAKAESELKQALSDFAKARRALEKDDFARYGRYQAAGEKAVQAALAIERALVSSAASGSAGSASRGSSAAGLSSSAAPGSSAANGSSSAAAGSSSAARSSSAADGSTRSAGSAPASAGSSVTGSTPGVVQPGAQSAFAVSAGSLPRASSTTAAGTITDTSSATGSRQAAAGSAATTRASRGTSATTLAGGAVPGSGSAASPAGGRSADPALQGGPLRTVPAHGGGTPGSGAATTTSPGAGGAAAQGSTGSTGGGATGSGAAGTGSGATGTGATGAGTGATGTGATSGTEGGAAAGATGAGGSGSSGSATGAVTTTAPGSSGGGASPGAASTSTVPDRGPA